MTITKEQVEKSKKIVKDITVIKTPTIPVLLKLLNSQLWQMCEICNERLTTKDNVCLYCYYHGDKPPRYELPIEDKEFIFVKQTEEEIIKGLMDEAGYSL